MNTIITIILIYVISLIFTFGYWKAQDKNNLLALMASIATFSIMPFVVIYYLGKAFYVFIEYKIDNKKL